MIYTKKKRKELNDAFCRKFCLLTGDMAQADSSLRVTTISLPKSAEELTSPANIRDVVPYNVFPWNAVLPVYIPIVSDGKKCYRVDYVNSGKESLEKAVEKMEDTGLFYVPGFTLEKGVDYE